MHHYQTVLVAVDFSQHSEKAIARAKQLAAMYEAELQLLHVIEEPMYPIYDDISLSATPNAWFPDMLENLQKAATEKLTHLAETNQIPATSCHTLTGFPKTQIVDYANQIQADLIVMGRHGMSFFDKLIGSTTDSVLHQAQCDVMAVTLDS
ncbi:universal stress protein UspA [Hydrogenovibrio crunogenus]|uniref:Universal stress protein n=1 Tax=Hydrogenovibrio crunogenus TaxID=39765 RepID=A0A4P7P167_9GAMM|nr:universal stress protein [Hydrogenovibrio crunogenus]QBZ83746.1 universal stress protein UspA [Hydrogenovibrio crunogenus]